MLRARIGPWALVGPPLGWALFLTLPWASVGPCRGPGPSGGLSGDQALQGPWALLPLGPPLGPGPAETLGPSGALPWALPWALVGPCGESGPVGASTNT